MKALRTRYGTAGNKDDRADAYLLGDVLRTDGPRLRPLRPDGPETVTLRATVRARKDLVQARTRLTQQLRAHLELAFPGAVGLFADLDAPIALGVPAPLPVRGQGRLAAARSGWPPGCAAQGYCGRTSPDRAVPPAGDGAGGRDRPRGRDAGCRRARSTSGLLLAVREQVHRARAPDRRAARAPPRRRHLHELPPGRPGTGGDDARRARRRPRTLPDARVARLPGGRGAIHPPVGAAPRGHLPVRLRQEAPRRADRLHRGQPVRQRLGGQGATPTRSVATRRTRMPAGSSPAPGSYVLWRCWQDRVPYAPHSLPRA